MRVLSVLCVLALLTGCGGGSANNPQSAPTAANPSSPPPPIIDADFGGIWFGSVTYADQTIEEMIGFSAPDGRFTLLTADTFGPDTFGIYVGLAAIDTNQVSGSGRAYAALGSTWADGSTVAPIMLSASVAERMTLSGTLSSGTMISGTFELEYDTEYEQASALSLLQDVWYIYDDLLNPTATFSFESDGSFLGQNVNGCQSSGQVSIIDANINLYAWDSNISNCPIAGSYSGLGVMFDISTGDPAASDQDNFFFAVLTSDLRALTTPLLR